MGDVPLTTSRSIGNANAEASDSSGEIPAWLAARRSRIAAANPDDSELEVEFESVPDTTFEEAPIEEEANKEPAVPPALPVVTKPVLPTFSPTELPSTSNAASNGPTLNDFSFLEPKPKEPRIKGTLPVPEKEPLEQKKLTWKEQFQVWVHSAGMKGVLVSVAVHTSILSVLALLVMGGAAVHPALDIFGDIVDPNVDMDNVVELDSGIGNDPGEGTPAADFSDVTQILSRDTDKFNPHEALRGGSGGNGSGNGNGGDGDGVGIAIKVPNYAVTKGSFSAWTEPKDPEPNQSYDIIIQFRLPSNVKSYRGSDLTGMVIGTDKYKQTIKFQRNEVFPVVDGAVRVNILVPGAAKLVRDTIRIESKLLHEKQVLEIEF